MICVQPAALSDAPFIHRLVTYWAERGDMLHRPLQEVYESIRDFKVARVGGEPVGCAALHIMGPDLAEIRSLAVVESAHGHGVGAALVRVCVEEARRFGLARVFALTFRPGFFERVGFRRANVLEFPQKVWNECVRCPFFTDCKEVAVVLDLDEPRENPSPAPRP